MKKTLYLDRCQADFKWLRSWSFFLWRLSVFLFSTGRKFFYRRDCEMTFIIGRGFAELQILKKWKWSITLKQFGIFWCTVADTFILTISSPRDCEMTFIIGRGFAKLQILKKWKSLELNGILRWNVAYILILTRCSPWDCQMPFAIDRGFAKVQILRNMKLVLSLKPFGIFW